MSADSRRSTAQSSNAPAAPYKPTLFDRLGPDAGLVLRALGFGVLTFGLSLPLSAGIAVKIDPKMPPPFIGVFALVCSAAISACAVGFAFALSKGAGRTFTRVTMGGSTTPYKEQYSREQALVMRGDVDAALESFEAVIAGDPAAIDARFKAAELYVKEKGNNRRAAELFREVQRAPSRTQGEDIYATNRLVDLYTGALAEPGRALVELRHLIERYPGSAAADHARSALATLKPRVHADG